MRLSGYVSALGLVVCLIWPFTAYSETFQEKQQCLAETIYHESRGEIFEGRLGVAYTVVNRATIGGFGNGICGVVYREGRLSCAFTWVCAHKGIDDSASFKSAWQLAGDVLKGKYSDPTYGALWFHEIGLSPDWSRDKMVGVKIGRHMFYPAFGVKK